MTKQTNNPRYTFAFTKIIKTYKVLAFLLWVFKISIKVIINKKQPLFYPDEVGSFSYKLDNGTEKKLTSVIWLPNDLSQGPFPLLVFSHGYLGFGLQWTELCRQLADNGYIVASTDHADHLASSDRRESKIDFRTWRKNNNLFNIFDNLNHFLERPKDIKALISRLLELNQDSSSKLYQKINPELIAVSGHSLGAWTAGVLIASLDKNLRDERIKAALLLSSPEWKENLLDSEIASAKIPKFFIFGDKDKLIPPKETITATFAIASPPKYLASISGMDHHNFTDFYPKQPQQAETMKYCLAFLDAYLKNSQPAKDILSKESPSFSVYKVETNS